MLKILFAAAAISAAAPPVALVERVSSEMNDYNPSFDRADRTMVFARSEADFAKAVIMITEKQRDGWSEPQPIEFSDPRFSDSDPWLTSDGLTLYFISDRPTASRPDKKDMDVWRSRRTAASWSPPEHLGDLVNGTGPELGPELHEDVLTFSTVRAGGSGGLDIYQSRLGPGGFGAPELLDGPFNSTESDSDFTISPDGRLAAFWRAGTIHLSERRGGMWSEPEALPRAINLGPFNFTPAFSADGQSLWYASTRQREGQEHGMADIYVASLPPAPK